MYRKLLIVWLTLLFTGVLGKARDLAFNEGWMFFRGEIPAAVEVEFDDSHWEPVTLPHDWSIMEPFSEENPGLSRGAWLPAGKGVYRKTFTVSADPASNKVFVYFDGA